MAWLPSIVLTLLGLPIAIGFMQGVVDALRRHRLRLRLVIFHDDE
jgi:hypothetical protein